MVFILTWFSPLFPFFFFELGSKQQEKQCGQYFEIFAAVVAILCDSFGISYFLSFGFSNMIINIPPDYLRFLFLFCFVTVFFSFLLALFAISVEYVTFVVLLLVLGTPCQILFRFSMIL